LKEELAIAKSNGVKGFIAFEENGEPSVTLTLYNYIMTLKPPTRPQEEHNAVVAYLSEQELETAIFLLE
jgi:hypothetical protein